MRLLADECIARPVVERLRSDGFDVAWVTEDSPGASDEAVLARANDEHRVLLTEDKDFGELTVRMKRPAIGVVIIALATCDTAETAERTARALCEIGDRSQGALTIIEAKRIRRRPLAVQRGV